MHVWSKNQPEPTQQPDKQNLVQIYASEDEERVLLVLLRADFLFRLVDRRLVGLRLTSAGCKRGRFCVSIHEFSTWMNMIEKHVKAQCNESNAE